MAYEPRTFQSATTNTPPAGTDPMVDNTANGDVQAIKLINPTAGSTAPWIAQAARAQSLPVALSTEDAALLAAIQALLAGGLPAALASGRLDVNVGASALPSGAATQATLASILAQLAAGILIAGNVEVMNDAGNPLPVNGTVTANLGTIADVATQTTLAAILAKIIAAPATEAKQDTTITALGTLLTTAAFQARINTLGQKAAANSTPVVLASDQSAIALDAATLAALETINAAQSGVWTVQPGNTANTTPWLVKETRAATPSQSSVVGSATSVALLAANANRLGATVYNDSSAILYLKLGATASTTSFSVAMAASSYFEAPFGYTGAIDGIWTSATGNARITELSA